MRRLLAVAGVLAVIGAALALALGSSAQGDSTYHFDVIFDDARGLIPGQLVKIAGAKAGTIDAVSITPGFKARISASVDGRFRPFHQDATCTIRPEGLIAENYIDCDPGNADSAPLSSGGGEPPTVPVTNTTEPVSLLNLFNIFNLPTRERFMVLVDELGIGFSGEGRDLNAVIRRANPSLALANRVIGILERQRAQLASLIDTTNTVAAAAAAHPDAVTRFIDRAGALSATIAAHGDHLSQAVARLPGMLSAARPALGQLDAVARAGTPLLGELRAAAPALNRVAGDIVPFASSATTGLAKLDAALNETIPALRLSTPVVRTLNRYARESLPSSQLLGRLFPNLQRSGFVENLLSVFYYVTAGTARYDSISHILPAYLMSPNNGACAFFASSPVPGCSANFGPQPAAAADHRPAHRRAHGHRGAAPAASPLGGSPPAAAPPASAQPTPAPVNPVASAVAKAKALVQSILTGAGAATGQDFGRLTGLLRGKQPPGQGTLQSLTSYLLR